VAAPFLKYPQAVIFQAHGNGRANPHACTTNQAKAMIDIDGFDIRICTLM
jgi:hypothetical protein